MEALEDTYNLPDFRHVPFRQRCDRKCCSTALWTRPSNPKPNTAQKQLLVPLTDVQIKGVLEAGHATIDV